MSRGAVRASMRIASPFVAALIAITTVAAAPDPSVDTIVADYIAARGGLAKIRSLRTLREKGHAFEDGGREAIVLREIKKPGRIRFEFTVQGITGVYVADNGRGWQVSPFDGDMVAKSMPEDAVTEAMEQADIEGPLVDWKAKGHDVALAGHEAVNGRDTYKLKVTLKTGAIRYEFIDVETHYHLRTDSTRQVRGRDVELTMTFSDHRMTRGVLFPRVFEVYAAGRPQRMRVVVDSVAVNPRLSDARFQWPTQLE